MNKQRSTVVMVIVGLVICVIIVGAGATTWFFVSVFDSAASDEPTAQRAFADIRKRLGNASPIIAIDGSRALLTRKAPDSRPATDLQRAQILIWEPSERKLSSVTLPWWLLRLKEGPINLTAEAGAGLGGPPITVSLEELERYGPALLLDHADEDGTRVLVWTE